MKAKTMFKELGYDKTIYKSADVIEYCKSDDEVGIDEYIDFDTTLKTYTAYSWCNNNMSKKRLEMDELKAINQQCIDLGW